MGDFAYAALPGAADVDRPPIDGGRWAVGPIHFNIPSTRMNAGDWVLGHAHNFDHPTIALGDSAFFLRALRPIEFDAKGLLVKAEVVNETTVDARDELPAKNIPAGVWHTIVCIRPGRYMCAYPHRLASVLSHPPGLVNTGPRVKRDEAGTLWVSVDEKIVEKATGWLLGYQ